MVQFNDEIMDELEARRSVINDAINELNDMERHEGNLTPPAKARKVALVKAAVGGVGAFDTAQWNGNRRP